MFKLQKRLELTSETKPLIISDTLESYWVKTLDEALKGEIKALEEDTYACIKTLGTLEMDRVYVVSESALESPEKAEKALSFVKELKQEPLIIAESFDDALVPMLFEMVSRNQYAFSTFKNEKPKRLDIHYLDHPERSDLVKKGIALGDAVNFTRDLVNTPYNHLNAEDLAAIAKDLAKDERTSLSVHDKKACEKMGMGAFLGVNAGSKDEPQFIHLFYQGNPDAEDHVALVGKGVMYDTGGYSLKTPTGMPSMKMDMGGAATVLGALKALQALDSKANVSVIIAATDNRIGDDAIVPDDILRSAKGTTIEVISTDAEGRLTLADALWYAQEEGARKLIDVATLTGNVVGALGDEVTGVFTNDEQFLNAFTDSAKRSKELVWHLPIMDPHRSQLESFSADMKNKGSRMGGASIAGAFLEHFVNEDVPWLHLDIAGTAYKEKSGATGTMVRTLVNMFE
ncbi:MAG: leucyl aminopeptidase family protein [Bacillota bacterium]